MLLQRVLEPEAMSDAEDASEYDAMDFSETDRLFVERATALAPTARRIADIGAGNGKIAVAVRARMGGKCQFCALDMSTEMLKLTRRPNAAESLPLLLIVGDAKSLPFPDRSLDLVLSNSLIHHVAVPARAFQEIARTARPGAGMLIRDLVRPRTQQELEGLVEQHASRWSDRQRRLFADSLHAALTIAEVRRCLDDCGLADVRLEQITDRHWSAERAATQA